MRENNLGQVDLVGSMGNDLTVVNSARVSFQKHTEEFTAGDERLIRYLAKHQHWTPFSHVMVTLRIKMPIFVARQWYKHQIAFTRNEVSRRYVSDPPTFYIPLEWREAPTDKKQGSGEGYIDLDDTGVQECVAGLVEQYSEMIAKGVAPEQARMILPQNMHTEFYETASLAAYARLYSLRAKPDAQQEIQWFAEQVGDVCSKICPVSWKHLVGGS